jgi:hypothetical protein
MMKTGMVTSGIQLNVSVEVMNGALPTMSLLTSLSLTPSAEVFFSKKLKRNCNVVASNYQAQSIKR